MSTSAKAVLSRSEQLEEILNSAQRKSASTQQKTAAKETDSRFANIETNAFHKIIFDAQTSDAQKEELLAKLLTLTGTSEELRENVKAYDLFKEYLQSVREEMAVDTIKMSDPKNFAVLRDTYESMNGGLVDFENKISPLTDLLEALETLRVDGETMDVFREIKDDAERNKAILARETEINSKFTAVKSEIDNIDTQIAVLNEDKNLFGQIKKGAREEQARLAIVKQDALAKLDLVASEEKTFRAENSQINETQTKNIDAKEKLKQMLELDASGHETRGNELINSAVNFVATSKQKIGTIRDHLSGMEEQIVNLSNSSNDMTYVFALLDGGTKKAEDENKKLRDQIVQPVKEGESTVERLNRDRKQRELDEHITLLSNSANDTTATIADLTSQSIRIKDMKDSNQAQIQMAREMHARGVAGVADRISTVIQAVGQAALSESSQLAASTLNKMRQDTDALAQKHSIQIAMGIQDRNADLEAAIENLEAYGVVHKKATEITKTGLAEMSTLINKMEATAKVVAEGVSKSYAQVADNAAGAVDTETPTEDKPKSANRLFGR